MLNSMTETAEPLVPDWSILGPVLIAGVVLFVGALISIARNGTYSSGGTVGPSSFWHCQCLGRCCGS